MRIGDRSSESADHPGEKNPSSESDASPEQEEAQTGSDYISDLCDKLLESSEGVACTLVYRDVSPQPGTTGSDIGPEDFRLGECDVPGPAERVCETAREELGKFIKNTFEAFGKQVVKCAAYAHGLGPVFEIYDWTSRVGRTVKALDSDNGMEVDLPFPVGGVEFVVRSRVGARTL